MEYSIPHLKLNEEKLDPCLRSFLYRESTVERGITGGADISVDGARARLTLGHVGTMPR